ncbi:unnamed protein product [Cuscuta epithymum]|uniref:Thioredoxin domain-containing protein n=1 Tax=Cuscuta epithymum TaxID=186058 RepID=A0AAV0D1Y5_9ASTE|nr:unnamed protein product [Cuscuta epithymum]
MGNGYSNSQFRMVPFNRTAAAQKQPSVNSAFHSPTPNKPLADSAFHSPTPNQPLAISGFHSSTPNKPLAISDFHSSTPNKPLVTAFHSSSQWKNHFNESKKSNKLMVIYFTATWCGPCKIMEPAINEMAEQYRDVEFVKIDTDELFDVAEEFEVQTMPTFILVKGEKVFERIKGAQKEVLRATILQHKN